MTDLELHQPTDITTAPALGGTLDPTGGRLVAWAQAAHAANELARALCNTSFVPRVKDRRSGEMVPISVGDATAQILMGDELGLSPLAALRSLFVVHGTPSMYARTMVALVQSHGHEVWTEASSDASVTVCGRRKGSTKIEQSTWTTARAQKAKYTGNPKYATNPQEMLYAKAAAEVCRKLAADVLAGIPATVEEIELEETPTVSVTRSSEPAKKAQRRTTKAAPAAPPEPGFEEPASPATPPEAPKQSEQVELRTEPQMRKLWALAKEHGLGGADDFKAYIAEEIGHPLESTKDLTKVEAGALIEQLEQLDPETGELPSENEGAGK